MAKKFRVAARIEAEDRASGTVGKVEGRFRKFGKFLKVGLVAAAAAAVAGLVALTKTLKASISAAQVQEDAVVALDAALRKLGPAADGVSKSLQDQAAALQKVTTFGDETIIKGQALIASFTQNEEQIKKATEAALNLSAGLGIDLTAAFLLMGKAASGETSTLSRYGIILDEGLSKQEKFAAALDKIGESFGGRAQAQALTFSGLLKQISNAFGDLLEAAGNAAIKNKAVNEQLEKLRDTLLSPGFIEAVAKLAEKIVATGVAAANAASKIVDYIQALDDMVTGAVLATGANADLVHQVIAAREAAEKAEPAWYDLGAAIGAYFRELEKAGKANREARAEQKKLGLTISENEEILRLYLASQGDVLEKQHLLNKANERAARIYAAEAEALTEVEKIAAALGVTLEAELNAELEKNETALLKAEAAARQGVITYGDLEKIQAALAESSSDLTQSIDKYTGGVERADRATRQLTESVNGSVAAIERQSSAVRGSSIGGPLISQQGPLISGGGPSGGVFTIPLRARPRPDGGLDFA